MAEIKLKLLRILDILKDTDQYNFLTINEIVEKLAVMDLKVDRKAVSRDIKILMNEGFDIKNKAGKKKGYYLNSRNFENWELKVLMDAVLSAKFLTVEDSNKLIEKLKNMTSIGGRKLLTRVSPVENKVKTNNVLTKDMIAKLLEAIRQKRKVQFQYMTTTVNFKKELRKDGYYYIINPYALTWQEDHYYLVCNTDQYKNLSYYRLDRMTNMSILSEPVKDVEALLGKNPGHRIKEFISRSIYCHSGEKINLVLLCKEGIQDEICDYFGDQILHIEKEDGFECHVRVMNSKGLIYWLMQHSSMVSVIGPAAVRQEMIKVLTEALKQYQ